MQHDDVGGRGHTGSVGGTRANVLWGSKRTLPLILTALSVAALALGGGRVQAAQAPKIDAYVSPGLLAKAEDNPAALFDVIVQARANGKSSDVAAEIADVRKSDPASGTKLKRQFFSIAGTSATLSGRQLLKLAKRGWIESVVEDARTGATYSNSQKWVGATEVLESSTDPWNASYSFPTIAIVDSGVQPRADFGSRLTTQVSFVSTGNSSGDGFGHGTMVAALAAGSAEGYTGVAPKANIVSLDVLNDLGVGSMGDAIAACDWILANKSTYNIRVANFSINAGSGASILYDPLDRAVEKLWLNGVVVVASAGNYAVNGAASGVRYSPAIDPFVITVGASDLRNTTDNEDDFAAPWSAWGYTYDGFFKPEIAAPGRVLTSAVPSTSTLALLFPSRKVGADYMWMSGTSFAAPIVSGAAAWFLAKYPSWTPDQVKGALMLDADIPDGYSSFGALGVGVLDADGWVHELASEPERGPQPVRRDRPRHRAQGVRRGELVERRSRERLVVECVVVERVVGGCLVVERVLVERVLVERVLVERLLGRCLMGGRLVGALPRRRVVESPPAGDFSARLTLNGASAGGGSTRSSDPDPPAGGVIPPVCA